MFSAMKRLQFLSLLLALLSIGVVSEAQYFRVQRLTLVATPTNDDTQTQVLVRNSTSGQVQYRSASTLLGTTDLSYTSSTRLLASSTGADVTLPLFTSIDAGLTPLSGGGTTNFLRADGTWSAPLGTTDLTYTASTRLLASSTGADVTLPLFTSTDAGLTPLSGGGTINFLRADGTWSAPLGTTNLTYTASTRLLASSNGTDVTLPLFTSTDGGLVPLSGGGTANFLRADGTWAAPSSSTTLAHGTFTPTTANVSNIDVSTMQNCQYLRVGNTVTVSGSVDVDATTASSITVISMTLPVASNLPDYFQLAGAITSEGTGYGSVLGDAATDRAVLRFTPSVNTSVRYSFTFTYIVL